MKLVGNLKKKVEKAENKEQAKELIAKAGMELNDEELDEVAGGGAVYRNSQLQDVTGRTSLGTFGLARKYADQLTIDYCDPNTSPSRKQDILYIINNASYHGVKVSSAMTPAMWDRIRMGS